MIGIIYMKPHKKPIEQISTNEHWQRVLSFVMHTKGIRELKITNAEMVATAKMSPPGDRPYCITIGEKDGFTLFLAYSLEEANALVAKHKEKQT